MERSQSTDDILNAASDAVSLGWRHSSCVAEYLSREIPHREIAESMLLDALPEQLERFIDLGTGNGRLIALVRERYPNASAIGIDFSQPMLDRAAQRFAEDPRVELRKHDLAEPLPCGTQVDAIVSALAIHHLEDHRKRSLFGEVHSLLAPAGVFVNLDLVTSANPAQHERFREAIGRGQDDPADRLADLCSQLDWLRQAGYRDVECQFKWLELALIVARRGTSASERPPDPLPLRTEKADE